LFSRDTLSEYAAKLSQLGIERDKARSFLARMILAGEAVQITFFHVSVYPDDSDDIAFLLCATNGMATHLVTYDSHYDRIRGHFDFQVCLPIEFLKELRINHG